MMPGVLAAALLETDPRLTPAARRVARLSVPPVEPKARVPPEAIMPAIWLAGERVINPPPLIETAPEKPPRSVVGLTWKEPPVMVMVLGMTGNVPAKVAVTAP